MFEQGGILTPRQKFAHIYSVLKKRIESGEYPVGQLLPSENTLIVEFSCSRNTVRRAISELVREGYVQTRQGWGVCNIFQPIEPSSYTMGVIESFRETSNRTGQKTSTRVVRFESCIADEKISAQTGRNLDTLISTIIRKLPDGDPIYPEDELTDETMRSIAQEIIREKILINTKDEIPHSVAVIIERYEESDEIDRIFAVIHVEHESQKGIMIGKKGSMLKTIGTQARQELEKMLEKKVYLELNVKVSKDWRKKTPDLENWV